MTTKLSELLLRDSQVFTAQFIRDNPFCAVFSDMGFGKTSATLTALVDMLKAGEVRRALVVSTKLVARETWPAEVEAWAHTAGLRLSVILGDAPARLAAVKSAADLYIINQENFVWLAELAGKSWPFDFVIFDDAKGFKSGKRKSRPATASCQHADDCPIYEHAPRARACLTLCREFTAFPSRYTRFGALCALRPQIKSLVHLTGTPTSKGLVDLWPLVYTLDGGLRLGRTFTAYKEKYFDKNFNGFGFALKEGSAEKIAAAIKDICIAIPSEAKLPECKHIPVSIRLDPAAAEKYDAFARDMVLALDGQEVEAVNAGVLAGKLLQCCNGAVYTEGTEWAVLHIAKLEALSSILSYHKGEPILIGYNFKHDLARLRDWLPQGIDIRDRPDAVTAWNAGQIPIMFVHPESAGHGLNLQKGPGHVLVWFGLNWSLSLNKQLNKRLHRPGQRQTVYIYYLIAEGRADEKVMEGVAKYDWTQNQLLAAVKRSVKTS